jgi:SAM-dependent methyltransferase
MTDQAAFWNGPAADRWVNEQTEMDAILRPYGAAALEAAKTAPGEAVLDVGCGCGDTTLALAERVGPSGRVLGLDVSAPMLARARERSAGLANVTCLEGDAARAPFDRATFDVLFSRFGVMFFADPAAAFAHLHSALRPGGRLAFVCWRTLRENPWATVPSEAAATVLGPPEPTPPGAPGPFAFGDASRVSTILEGAGFREVALRPFDTHNSFGGGGSLADAAVAVARLGTLSRLLVGQDESIVRRVLVAVEAALPPFVNDRGGVSLPAAAWVVTAAA